MSTPSVASFATSLPDVTGSSRATWSPADRLELQSIAHESDAGLRAEGLLALARRLEAAGRVEAAVELYAAVVQEADALGVEQVQPLRARAQEHLDAILGRGAVGPRAEFLLRNLAQQAGDPTMLFAMGTAGAVFRMTRLATLARLAAAPNPGWMTQLLGAGRLASLTGFALEAPAFTLAARLGNEALGRSQDWSGRALGRDFASSYLVLGGLKVAGWGSGAIHRRLAGSVGAEQVQPLRTLFQQGGMLAGILLGHSLEEHLGLRPRQDGATTFVDSLAMLLQFNVAGRLTRQAFGPRFAAWEQGLDLRAEALTQRRPGGRVIPPWNPGWDLGPRQVLAGVPLRPAAGSRGEALTPEGPSLVFMTGRGRGGGSWRQELQGATELRLQFAPDEAWARRAELTAEYVARLRSLPSGRREVLEEMQQGLELVGAWLAGRDGFRKAIGSRHYAELWGLLAGSWTHLSLNAAMTDTFRSHVDRHRGFLGSESNPRFLSAALEATPDIARVYSHTQGALVEGSPRERELGAALVSLVAVLRTGATAPVPTALRSRYVEALHDTLNNSAGGGALGLAREALAGVRLMHHWMLAPDAERAELGRNYFPRFWRLLAERARPDFKDSLLVEMQQEIVFLQQHTRPYSTPREVLLPSLHAFPHYVETVLSSVGPEPGTSFALIQTFLSQAQALRPWILEHSDPQVRAVCADSYLRLMTLLQSRATEIVEYERHFPASPTAQVTQELLEAVAVFAQRWKTRDPEALLPALRDYQALTMLLPARPDLVPDLLAESNLKPLMNLQYHPDPRVRPAIEELLVKLVARFSKATPGGGSSN